MRKSLIVAFGEDRVMGLRGDMPWGRNCPTDLARFREVTKGHVVIMGMKTHLSIGRALPKRVNIVITSRPGLLPPGCVRAESFADALAKVPEGEEEIFFIGGESVYRYGISVADRMYITFISGRFEGDVFFPKYDEDEWEEILDKRKEIPIGRDAYPLTFFVYDRKK